MQLQILPNHFAWISITSWKVSGCAVNTQRTLIVYTEARWWTRDEILAVLHHRDGTTLSQRDRRELFTAAENLKPTEQPSATSGANPLAGDAVKEGEKAAVDAAREPSAGPLFKMPPVTAVAGVLINEWAHGRAGFQPESPKL